MKVNFIFRNSIFDARSVISRNINVIVVKEWSDLKVPAFTQFNADNSPECQAIRELLDMRNDIGNVEGLDSDDIDGLIMMLCMR